MTRSLRIEVENGIQHVWSRGNDKQKIVLEDRHRLLFLDVFEETLERYEWDCLAYCLMGNHYHLLIKTPHADMKRGMQRLNSVYAKRFNKDQQRCDHLFGRPYGSRLVEHGGYLLRLMRYIARNPVKSEFCARPEDWRWSSARAILGLAEPRCVKVETVLPLFGTSLPDARVRYAMYVNDPSEDEDSSWLRGAVLGSQEFIDRHLPRDGACREIARGDRFPNPPTLSELVTAESNGEQLAATVFEHGYSMAAIADELGCHYSTVSKRIKAWRTLQDARSTLDHGKSAA
jgi:putative transposase